jgi:hypothetical protein
MRRSFRVGKFQRSRNAEQLRFQQPTALAQVPLPDRLLGSCVTRRNFPTEVWVGVGVRRESLSTQLFSAKATVRCQRALPVLEG